MKRALLAFLAFIRRHLIWILVIVALIAVAGAAGWWLMRPQKPHYVTARVSRGTIQRTVEMTGVLDPVKTVQVGSYVSGTIKELTCDFNTEVKVGQVCAKIDPQPFQVIVDQDRANLDAARAQLMRDEAALRYTSRTFERDRKLLESNSVSQDTVDSDRSTFEQGQAQIALDKANIASSQAQLKAAEVNLAYTIIASPVDGVVITRNVEKGQTVASSLQTPTLFLIAQDLAHMQVEANVSEADVSVVQKDQKVFFSIQAYPDKTFQGVVREIRRGPITVQNVVTYDVVVAVDNPGSLLFPGMTADTHIITAERDDVLRVPLRAVRFTPEGVGRTRRAGRSPGDGDDDAAGGEEARTFPGERPTGERGAERPGEGVNRSRRSRVWVLRDGALKAVPVRTGLDDGTLIEVAGSELKVGDVVVVDQDRVARQTRTNGGNPFAGGNGPGGPGGQRRPGFR